MDKLESIYFRIGIRITSIRAYSNITQGELARRIGLTRSSVANIETGRQRIQLHQLEKIASALDTTIINLLRGIWV